jgi:anti-sigma regulatory factor (Ser/Thr protein kinase)
MASPDAERAPDRLGGSLPPPGGRIQELTFTGEDLGTLRQALFARAREFELGHERAEELVLAANEVASNSVRHGGGRGTMRMWSEQDTLLIEIHDRGHIEEPLATRSCPAPDHPDGRGLWLVNELCDQVEIRSSSEGSVIRLHMRRA